MNEIFLQVRGLATHFFTDEGVVKAVNGVSFTLDRQETLGIVGESGSGKTVTALSVMRLVPDPPGKVVAGTDRVAVDAYCASLWGLDPKDIVQIRRGAEQGLGRIDLDKVVVREENA